MYAAESPRCDVGVAAALAQVPLRIDAEQDVARVAKHIGTGQEAVFVVDIPQERVGRSQLTIDQPVGGSEQNRIIPAAQLAESVGDVLERVSILIRIEGSGPLRYQEGMLLRDPRNVGRTVARQDETAFLRPSTRTIEGTQLDRVSGRGGNVDSDLRRVERVISVNDVGQVFIVVGTGEAKEVIAAIVSIGVDALGSERSWSWMIKRYW